MCLLLLYFRKYIIKTVKEIQNTEGKRYGKIIYLEDRINGLHCYTPEMGQRKPDVKLEARLSHYGNYYIVDTPLELNGRGITKQEVCWVAGCKQQIENWLSYRVTEKAFEKLQAQYPISMECVLD